jgi:hypothetical protein
MVEVEFLQFRELQAIHIHPLSPGSSLHFSSFLIFPQLFDPIYVIVIEIRTYLINQGGVFIDQSVGSLHLRSLYIILLVAAIDSQKDDPCKDQGTR